MAIHLLDPSIPHQIYTTATREERETTGREE
jgi:hypothetical protein